MAKRIPGSPSETMRKLPTQERAQRTIETIFETTAQILESEGEAGLTTNKVAEKAGFSIGTLYQYFPSKDAILTALIARERRRVMDELDALMESAETQIDQLDPKAFLRQFIRINIEGLGSGRSAKRAMIRFAWQHDHHEDITQALRETAERIAISMQRIHHPNLRPPTPAMMFVVTRAVIGAIRSASLEKSPLLGSVEFEDELVQLAWGMLARPADL